MMSWKKKNMEGAYVLWTPTREGIGNKQEIYRIERKFKIVFARAHYMTVM